MYRVLDEFTAPAVRGGRTAVPPALLARLRPRARSWSAVAAPPLDLAEVLGDLAAGPPLLPAWTAQIGAPDDIVSALSLATRRGASSLELTVAEGCPLPQLRVDTVASQLRCIALRVPAGAELDLTIRGVAALTVDGGRKADVTVAAEPGCESVRLLLPPASMVVVPAGWAFYREEAPDRAVPAPMGFLYAKDGFDGRAVSGARSPRS